MFAYIREHIGTAAVFALCCAVFAGAFALYGLPIEAAAYPSALCAALLAGYCAVKCRAAYKKHRELHRLAALPADLCEALRAFGSQTDEDYRAVIESLCEREASLREADSEKLSDMTDYYTTWAHQIKTPIASMKLKLQSEDSASSRFLSEELFKVDQYVEMVLAYVRLGSETTDYVFRECELDAVIKSCLRSFAGQFIGKGIKLVYAGTDKRVLTDAKWLSFVLGQVLSNALKYTQSGAITVSVDEPALLRVSDTGIGVAQEDLPRIFEKGYTGYNGRTDGKASGLGLYLCRRVCRRLGHTITAQSEPGAGTTIAIDLSKERGRYE